MLMANATILVVIKASLCSNNWLLEANLTRRTVKIVVLDSCAYPELRLLNKQNGQMFLSRGYE